MKTMSLVGLMLLTTLISCQKTLQNDGRVKWLGESYFAENLLNSVEGESMYKLVSDNPQSCREELTMYKGPNQTLILKDSNFEISDQSADFETYSESEQEDPFASSTSPPENNLPSGPVWVVSDIGHRHTTISVRSEIKKYTKKRVTISYVRRNDDFGPYYKIIEKIEDCFEIQPLFCLLERPRAITTSLKIAKDLNHLEIYFPRYHRSELMREKESTCLYQKVF